MKKIITIDSPGCILEEDGFGIDSSNNFFIAICKEGFLDNKLALIFTFKTEGIYVTRDYVEIVNKYKVNNYLVLLENETGYNLKVIRRIYKQHKRLSSKNSDYYDSIRELNYNVVLANILGYLYRHVGPIFKQRKANLKKSLYSPFLKHYCEIERKGKELVI